MEINRKKEMILTDFVRFSWKATRGLIDNPEEHVPYWNDRLGRTGKLTPEQVDLLSQFIHTRISSSHTHFLSTVNETIEETVHKLAEMTEQELDALDQKITRMNEKIKLLSKSKK